MLTLIILAAGIIAGIILGAWLSSIESKSRFTKLDTDIAKGKEDLDCLRSIRARLEAEHEKLSKDKGAGFSDLTEEEWNVIRPFLSLPRLRSTRLYQDSRN